MKDFKKLPLINKIWEKFGFNVFLIIGAVGLLLCTIPEKSSKKQAVPDSTEEYVESLQNNLTDIIGSIQGVGKVKIMITLESGEETVFATQEKIIENGYENNQKSSYESEVVIITNGGEKTPLVKRTLQPVVQGVVVACQGADDIRVVSEITNAVSVALCVTSNRVCVIKMQ